MASKLTRWTPLENKIYRLLKTHKVGQGKALIAVSGGQDSLLLAEILFKLSSALKLELSVIHIHHGGISPYRKKAQDFVKKWSAKKKIPFFTKKSKQDLKSEDEAREFRREAYAHFQKEIGADYLFLGHHQDDLLETRLLRILRGTGPQGLEAMRVFKDGKVRPFLTTAKSEIIKASQGLDWVEDPSNSEAHYFRNWLRQEWLPALEKKSPGALKSMAKSFELLLESHEPRLKKTEIHSKKGISRTQFLSLTETEKRQCLAQYVLSLKVSHFTQNHLREIIKHLDNSKNLHTFKVAQLNWTLTKDRIFALRSQ